jgi:purine-nucleoside phosphorylase
LRDQLPGPVDVTVTLGSGLREFVNQLENTIKITATSIPGYPDSRVAGHENSIYYGNIARRRILVFSGRLHIYEGCSFEQAAFPALAAAALGSLLFIATNAAGGINPLFSAGDFMLIREYLVPPVAVQEFGSYLIKTAPGAMVSVPSTMACNVLRKSAEHEGILLHEGSYAYVLGPSYETSAEILMLHKQGADAVGMSTVPELIAASRVKLPWLGISCITNKAAALHSPVSHENVTHVAGMNSARLARLLQAFIKEFNPEGAPV